MIWTIICFVIAAAVVAVDQITKVIVVDKLAGEGPFVVIPGVLRFTYVENQGMALGLLGDARWVFMTVSVIVIVALMAYLIKWRPESKFASVALSLIIGGGIGNMIDRMFFRGVIEGSETYGKLVVRDFIDFIGFGRIWCYVFNVADACVCVGGGMLLLWCIVAVIKEAKAEKATKAAKAAENAAESKEGSETMVEEEKIEKESDSSPKEEEENKE